jgi:hypothetical protein
MIRSRPRSILHRVAALATLLALLAMSALPPGVMPGRTEAGLVTLVLCTPDGPREMQVDFGPTGETPDPSRDCPFAVVHGAVILPDAPAALGPPVTLAHLEVESPRSQPTRTVLLHNPPARGPPLRNG